MMALQAAGRHVHAAGVRVWVEASGPPAAPAVVLVHGLAASGSVWRKVAPVLAARGLHVLVPDLPGHGRSDGKRHRGTYSPRFFARVLVELLDALGVERACLVGNSLGGVAVARAALLDPARTAGLILVDSAGLSADGVPWSTRLMYVPFALAALLGASPSPLWLRLFLQRAVVADPSHAAELADLLGEHPPLPAAVRRSALGLIGPEGRIGRLLQDLTLPTLFIWGDRDVQFPLSLAETAAARMPNARLARIAGAGHVPQWEAPDAVACLIGDFALADRPEAPRLPHESEAPGTTGRARRLYPRRSLHPPLRPPLSPPPRLP